MAGRERQAADRSRCWSSRPRSAVRWLLRGSRRRGGQRGDRRLAACDPLIAAVPALVGHRGRDPRRPAVPDPAGRRSPGSPPAAAASSPMLATRRARDGGRGVGGPARAARDRDRRRVRRRGPRPPRSRRGGRRVAGGRRRRTGSSRRTAALPIAIDPAALPGRRGRRERCSRASVPVGLTGPQSIVVDPEAANLEAVLAGTPDRAGAFRPGSRARRSGRSPRSCRARSWTARAA